MTTILNPFIFKGEIPEAFFCDRVKETELLISHILNGRNVVLMSPRRVGKTGLIAHCFNRAPLSTDYNTFFVDILHTTSLNEFTYALGREIFEKLKPQGRRVLNLFVQTVRSISGELGYDVLTGMPKFNLSIGAIQNPEYTLSEIFDYINKSDKRCVIAIDEFQQISRYPEKNIEAILRAHIQHCGNADFIFAGSERHILEEMFNQYSRPFYASSTEMNLVEIDKAVYCNFAEQQFLNFGKSVDTDVVARLHTLFEGNTFCMQKTLNEAFAHTKANQYCDYDITRTAIEEILLENDRTYKNKLSQLTSKPKELLIAIAKDIHAKQLTSGAFVKKHHLSSPSSVQSAVKQLLQDDWISYATSIAGDKYYFIPDRFFALWLRKSFSDGYDF